VTLLPRGGTDLRLLPIRGPAIVAVGAVLLAASAAHADARRFAYSYEAVVQPQGAFEYEQWITWKTHKENDPDFTRLEFRHEIEYGLTDTLQLALYIADWRYQSGASVEDDGLEFRNSAVEVIYQLSDPVTKPLGLAAYGEVKLGPELFALEGKLIAQIHAGKWIYAWNGTIEAEWEERGYTETKGEFEMTYGASYQIMPSLLAGFEMLHEVEYKDWATWSDAALYAGPNLSFRTMKWWITVAPLFQVTNVNSEPDFQLRFLFGFDF
jgi:hypothetical protein